jgi:hypothetical protein
LLVWWPQLMASLGGNALNQVCDCRVNAAFAL